MGGRRDVLLGKYGTKESRAEYARVIAEWEAEGHRLAHADHAKHVSINELILAFWEHAQQHYRREDGSPTSEIREYKAAFRSLKEMYGHTPAEDFGPVALKAIRDRWITQPVMIRFCATDLDTGKRVWKEKEIRQGLCRGVINQRMGRIRRLFKWGASQELVGVAVFQALGTLAGLQRGRSKARETKAVRPVSLALVEETLPDLPPTIADMIRLQSVTGARSGEICVMRGCDLDCSGAVWLYRPMGHKMAYRGLGRVIPLGPAAQEIVKRHLKPNTEAFLFSPRDAMDAFRQRQRAERKTPIQPSQQNRRKAKPRRRPGERYTPSAIAHAVRSACERAGLAHWHPHQLRHSVATRIRREHGLDAARALLGQQSPQVAEMYAELDLAKAVEAVKLLG
jgi:integrase